MKTLTHLSDAMLRRELIAAVECDRVTTSDLLAHIAEFDARKLYAPEGYSSMHAYCVGELHLSEDAAAKRIQAARAARKFPRLLAALAEGKLHLTAVCLLAPHLTAENVDELIEAATHQRKIDVEALLARRFPDSSPPAMPASIRALSESRLPLAQHAPAHVGSADLLAVCDPESLQIDGSEHAPAHVGGDEHAPAHVGDGEHAPAHVASDHPAATTERFLVQVTIDKDTYEKLRHAQALLSHSVRNGDLAQVLGRALDALITEIEKRKFGDGRREIRQAGVVRAGVVRNRSAAPNRHIPAPVRRAVWERDGGRCTFVSKSGHRCGERRFLELDHVEPVARGGSATVNGLRLRCRAHNQYEAERVFGAGFMQAKRDEARFERTDARARAEEQRIRVAREQTEDVVAGLRALGCRLDQARRAAEYSAAEGATLEERMRAALQYLGRRTASAAVTTIPPATFAAPPGCCPRPPVL